MKSRRFFFLAMVAVSLTITSVGKPPTAEAQTKTQADRATVQLVVDFGHGFQKRYTQLPHSSGMTVLDALKLAKAHRFPLKFAYRGSNDRALLQSIDGQANEGGGQRNWIFRVNEELGDRSFAIYQLDAGDIVLWRFERYQ